MAIRGCIPQSWITLVFEELAGQKSKTYQGIDGFGGRCRFQKCMRKAGKKCAAFDKEVNSKHDVTTKAGTRIAVNMAIRCKKKSLARMGPPCNNFIGLSRAGHGRTKENPLGFDNARTRLGNCVAEFVANFIMLLGYVDLHFFVEQPASSVLWYHPAIKDAMERTGATRVNWHMFAFGHGSPKPQVGYTNAPWAGDFQRLARRRYKKVQKPTARLASVTKGGKFCGNKNTAGSKVYPVDFVKSLMCLNDKYL